MLSGEAEGSGLFYSSLDIQQSKSDNGGKHPLADHFCLPESKADARIRIMHEGFAPKPEAVETLFRHSSWRPDRKRVREAMIAANVPAQRLERFDACGGECRVEYSRTLNKHRLKAFYCGDRFCMPCARARSNKVKRKLLALCQGKKVRFITFTLRNDEKPLKDVINLLTCSFSKVRECMIWRSAVDGGAAVMEIKRGSGSGNWHVHLHCLVVGRYLDQRELSRAWAKASGGSFVVDVREVKDHEKGVGYVAAYAGKGFDKSVIRTPNDLLECLCSLRGDRMLRTFGEWWNSDVDGDAEQVADWKMVGRFGLVVSACLRGDHWAVGVMRCLKLNVAENNGRIFFPRSEPDG